MTSPVPKPSLCRHATPEGVNRTPILRKLTGPAAARYGYLPKIKLPGDNELQNSFNNDVAHVLRGSGLYRRDIIPVLPLSGRLLEMTPAQFISWSTDHFIPMKMKTDRAGNQFEVIHDMTEQTAKNTLNDYQFIMKLPPIHRIYPSPVPYINAANALVLCTPGYDPSTGTYIFPGPLVQQPSDPARPPISDPLSSDGYFDDSMTPGEAFWTLYDLHCQFPFADWREIVIPPEGHPLHAYDPVSGDHRGYRLSRSLAVHIGAMLAMFAGNCIPREASRMIIVYNANAQRSGKSLLASLIAAPVHGSFKAQSWRKDEESMIKILDSEAIAGSPYICFDNVRGLIASQALEGFITSSVWTGRHLGRTEMFTAENNALIIITGNNINAGTDIHHRSLWCNLYVEDADPQARRIAGPIMDAVWLAQPENRRKILSALWSIVRHWDYAGRPYATGETYQGFDTWGKMIGGMVEFAGFGDMLERPKMENAGDSEAEDIALLVRHLWLKHHQDYTFPEIIHACWENGYFPWNLQGREEAFSLRAGEPAVITLRLNDTCASRMGLLLSRHATERGTIHEFTDPATLQRVRCRFQHCGKGMRRRFMVTALDNK